MTRGNCLQDICADWIILTDSLLVPVDKLKIVLTTYSAFKSLLVLCLSAIANYPHLAYLL